MRALSSARTPRPACVRAAALALAGCLLTGCAGSSAQDQRPRSTHGASPTQHGSGRPPTSTDPSPGGTGTRITRLLAAVRIAETSYHPGYDRDCTPRACVFGEEWTDDHPGRFGHNGCDTRQDVLLTQLHDVELRWGSTCRVHDGWLVDPYTGERLTWRDDGYWIQVDHVYPLAQAWYAGAWDWSRERRVRLANDVERELLAVSATANQAKGAGTLGEWLPPSRAFRCEYVVRYLRVALAYDLPITPADERAARALVPGCGSGRGR